MAKESVFDKIERIKKSIRISIFAGTLVLLAGLFIWFVYMPKTEEIDKTTEQIRDLDMKIGQAKIKTKDLDKLNATKADVDARFQEALILLPNEKEIPNLLRKVTELGNDSQLGFRIFKPQKETPKDFYVEIPVSIEVLGKYHNVAVFFDKVGRMDRIMNVHNVSMRPVKERSTDLITKCDAITYRFKGITDEEAPTTKK